MSEPTIDELLAENDELRDRISVLQNRSDRRDAIIAEYPDICFCGCHYRWLSGGMIHFVACCHRCPGCGHRIHSHLVAEHAGRCPGVAAIRERDVLRGRLAGMEGQS